MFLFTAQSAFAVTIKQIVSRPIFKPEVAVLSKLIKEHKHMDISDFRNLLRNYIGDNAIKSGKKESGINALLKAKGTYKKGSIVVKSQYFLKNGKIVKEKIHRISINTLFAYLGSVVTGEKYTFINSWLIHQHVAGKELAELVYHILRHYPNIYKNINAQGNHYQNALWIAADRGLFHTIFVLMKDKNLKYNITGESIYFFSNNYCTYVYTKDYSMEHCSWRNSQRMTQYITSKINDYSYFRQGVIRGGGYAYGATNRSWDDYGVQATYMAFFIPTEAFTADPLYALELHNEKNSFDTQTKERLFNKTLPSLL